MMYRALLSIFLCMAVFQVSANASNNYDVTYCYTCDMADMERRAAAMLGEAEHKTVAVINYRTDAITSFSVIDASEPGFYSIIAAPTATPADFRQLIEETIQKFRAIKAIGTISTAVLPGSHRSNFPRTAHELVGDGNSRSMVLNGFSSYLEAQSSNSSSTAAGHVIVSLVNKLVGNKELMGVDYVIQFPDGSSVKVKISRVSTNGSSGDLMFYEEYIPDSMVDSEGNNLPFDPKDLAGRQYSVGGGSGGAANILAWRSMLNRLRSLGYFRGMNCEWEDDSHVVCIYE